MVVLRQIYYLLVEARPRQWLKNLAVFAAIFFGGRLLEPESVQLVFLVFLTFCALSSSMYIFNDVIDVKADQAHFSKKERPLAKGLVSTKVALFISILLASLGITLSFMISDLIFLTAVAFLLLQIGYSLFLKQVIILDILTIAFTFILRVFAGSFVISQALSSWLILTVMMLAIFLAVGKDAANLLCLSSDRLPNTVISYPTIQLSFWMA